MKFVNTIKRAALNLPGWSTKRKIVVFESDDWGSIRSTKTSYDALLNKGYTDDKDLYARFDCLESNEDLEALFTVLAKFKDHKGNHPVITANTIMGNPDFDKIRDSGFNEYFFEPFTKTLERYYPTTNAPKLWLEGVKNKFFTPQFHGREHLKVNSWMHDLKFNMKGAAALAFEHGVFCYPLENSLKRENFMASFDIIKKEEEEAVLQSLKEGLALFENFFGFHSKTLIAPCYVWSKTIEKVSASLGIKGIQGIPWQQAPNIDGSGYSKIFHFTGQKNIFEQYYLVRNAFFEPTLYGDQFSVQDVLDRMKIAFWMNKPLIIGTHRINFAGGIHQSNRDANLKSLESLLATIIKLYPDVEFMSSNELVELVSND